MLKEKKIMKIAWFEAYLEELQTVKASSIVIETAEEHETVLAV
jgi:hypothetical protein